MIEKKCLHCKSTYSCKPYLKDKRKFCSHECDWRYHTGRKAPHRMKGYFVYCKKCNNKFYVRPCDTKKGGKFCSKECQYAWWKGKSKKKKIGIHKNCQHCKKEFYTYKCLVDQGRGKYCSHECSNKARRGKSNKKLRAHYHYETLSCKQCNNKFSVVESKIRNRTTGKKKSFCSIKCKGEWQSENVILDKHHNWLGGISFDPYPISFNKKFKKIIRERDNNTCQLCGINKKQLGMNVCVHHIDYVKENTNQYNCISLCTSCNAKVNTKREYWTNFFQEKINQSIKL